MLTECRISWVVTLLSLSTDHADEHDRPLNQIKTSLDALHIDRVFPKLPPAWAAKGALARMGPVRCELDLASLAQGQGFSCCQARTGSGRLVGAA